MRLGQEGVEGRRHARRCCARAGRCCAAPGGWTGEAGRNGACGASAKPAAAERLVSGVPPARSAGGGGGLPDLPREARGRGVRVGRRRRAGFGGAGHGGDIWRFGAVRLKRAHIRGQRLLTTPGDSRNASGGELLFGACGGRIVDIVRAWRSESRRAWQLARLLAVFGASLGGYAGLGPWVIAVAAIALASVSRAQYSDLYERGRDLGLLHVIDATMLRSFGNALACRGIAYGGGWVLRMHLTVAAANRCRNPSLLRVLTRVPSRPEQRREAALRCCS